MTYLAAIMDFDGTIVDGYDVWMDMYNLFEQQHNIKLTPEEKQKIYVGSVRSVATQYLSIFPTLKETFTIDSLTTYFVDNSLQGTLNSPPIEGCIEYIKLLHSKSIPIAIASSSTAPTIKQFLQKWNVDHCICDIVTGSDVKRCKPAPDIYIEAAKRCNVQVEKSVVFEDRLSAVKGAKEAGFHTVLIKETNETNENVADISIDNFKDCRLLSLF
ncbi:2-deoxyglucose-6-phosphate phosphatase [Entamoeba marina]